MSRLPVPDWGRPGETWRVEAENGGWRVVRDGLCSSRYCYRAAVVLRPGRTKGDFLLCAVHVELARMWIENGQLVSWCLRP